MNTADRSLAMIGYALRRRFSFFEFKPAFATEGFKTYQASIANRVGSGFRVGHNYERNKFIFNHAV